MKFTLVNQSKAFIFENQKKKKKILLSFPRTTNYYPWHQHDRMNSYRVFIYLFIYFKKKAKWLAFHIIRKKDARASTWRNLYTCILSGIMTVKKNVRKFYFSCFFLFLWLSEKWSWQIFSDYVLRIMRDLLPYIFHFFFLNMIHFRYQSFPHYEIHIRTSTH